MSYITERWSGKTRTRGNFNSDTAVRIFDVISQDDVATDDEAMDALHSTFNIYVGCPYSSNAESNYLYCNQIIARDISVGIYEVTATFGIGNYVNPENPISLPWKYKWQNVTIEPPFDRDINGNAIVTSSLCPFSSQPTKRISYKSLSIQRNEAFYNYSLYKTYENTVNSDSIEMLQPDGNYTIFGPGTIFCTSIEPASAYTQLDNYVPMVLNFEIYDLSTLPSSISDPFQLQILDASSMAWWNNGGIDTKGNIWTAQGTPVTSDQNLNSLGRPVDTTLRIEASMSIPISLGSPPPGATVVNPTSNVFYLKYLRYQSKAFLPLMSEPSQQPNNSRN